MMESNGSDAVMVSAVDEAECSETTVQIKIKTLDSQTYTLHVNKRVPVPELKEQIETVTGVVSNQQRLICRGKVLKDDQLLSAYHVEDGHTLHLVVRQPLPPSSEPTNSSTGSESFADPATDPTLNAGQSRVALAHSILLGSFNMADQGDAGIPDLGRIVSAVLGSIGMNNLASSTNIVENRGLSMESGAESLEIPARATGVSSAQTDPQRDSSHGAFYHPSTASLGSLQPPVIPNSLTTLSQYLRHLRHEFISIGGHSSNPVDAATCLNEEHEQNSTYSATQVGLPTAASLADVMASTRQLLFEQVGQSLAQLARQLVNQAGLTNQSSRTGIQSSAMRTGVSLQNLGALLLELGRTTMTLRIGQTPPDAVVNAGPAVFISPSGPNPIMVQPLPFQPGSGFGATSTRTLSAGSALSGFFPRNIDIRIRTGSSLNTSNVNQGEQVGTQQTPGQTGPARDPGSGIAHQEVRVSGVPSLNGESGVRVVPVRTMVAAVPAGATRPTSGSPGSSAGLLFPIIARVQHLAPVQANSVRGSQPSSEHHPSNPEADRQQNPNAPVQPQNVRVTIGATRRDGFAGIGDPFSSGMMQMPSLRMQDPLGSLGSLGSRSNTGSGSGPPNGEETASQIPRSHQVHTANFGSQAEATDSTNSQGANRNDATPRLGIDDGIFLSRLIREVLPYISQNSTSEPTSISPEGVDGSNNRNSQTLSTQSADRQTDAGTSRRRSDPPPSSPYGKRQKRE